MKKLLAVLNPTNRYRNALYFGSEKLIDGNSGLESVRLDWKGKRAVLELVLTDVALIVQSDNCPEEHRYPEISAAFGDRQKLEALHPVCELLQMSATACDGCVKRPSSTEILEFKPAAK